MRHLRPFPFFPLAVTLLLVAPAVSFSEPPPGYYASVDVKTQTALRSTLHEIIDDHIRFPYTSSNTDTWDILELADEDPNNPSNILDVYKNASYLKAGGGNTNYEREHTWPNSYGFPDDGLDNYPYTDCHALFLADGSYNASRGNNLYRFCSASCTEKPTDVNNGQGGGTGVYPGNSNWRTGSGSSGTWETWIGRRGDVARALFYLDVRYEGGFHGVTGVAEPDLILTDDESLIVTSGGVNAPVAYMGMRSALLEWHRQDPVDDLERHRNDTVASFQGNRNPFIDLPNLADCAIGGDCGSFYTVTPCRIVDTRDPDGPYGGPILTSGVSRFFSLPGNCGIPASAESVSVNITVIGATGGGHLTFYPEDQVPPATSTINFPPGLARANNALLRMSKNGVLGVQPMVVNAGEVHVIIDVSGYFD
jgi:endonuclease I